MAIITFQHYSPTGTHILTFRLSPIHTVFFSLRFRSFLYFFSFAFAPFWLCHLNIRTFEHFEEHWGYAIMAKPLETMMMTTMGIPEDLLAHFSIIRVPDKERKGVWFTEMVKQLRLSRKPGKVTVWMACAWRWRAKAKSGIRAERGWAGMWWRVEGRGGWCVSRAVQHFAKWNSFENTFTLWTWTWIG